MTIFIEFEVGMTISDVVNLYCARSYGILVHLLHRATPTKPENLKLWNIGEAPTLTPLTDQDHIWFTTANLWSALVCQISA